MSKTRSKEHQRSRAAFEEAFPAMDFTRINIPGGGTRYADLGTFQAWRGWKGAWRHAKEWGTNP